MSNSADSNLLASDLDLHCLQRQGISGLSRTRIKINKFVHKDKFVLILHKTRVATRKKVTFLILENLDQTYPDTP